MPKGQSHNPYFNRWFSAIYKIEQMTEEHYGHNPYFNRWFSAICNRLIEFIKFYNVTILILIDGFLQYQEEDVLEIDGTVTILILIDGFLQSYG